jgi:methyl-accepting chemotaxis protein
VTGEEETALLSLLHYHPAHRARQIRWVLPTVGLLLLAVLVTMGVLYQVGNQDVGTEFFRAHKTISHTGQLLQRGLVVSVVVLTALLLGIGIWALSVMHKIVRPVHTLHQVLDDLAAGDLGVRLALHRRDEFQEVGISLNHLINQFSGTLAEVHRLVDQVEALAAEVAEEAHDRSKEAELHRLARQLNATMEYFQLEPVREISEVG